MLDQNRLDLFLADKAAAESRKQQAIREAHEAFNRAYLLEKARHAAEYEKASARWNAVKSNPEAKGYDEAWQAFQDAKLPADHTLARAELDAAIRAADAASTRGDCPVGAGAWSDGDVKNDCYREREKKPRQKRG
jgi:hypothetical protein